MTALRLLNLRRLLQQPLRALVAVVAVAAGVALTLGVVVARTSVDRSFDDLRRFVNGPATLRVEGPLEFGGLRMDAVDRVGEVPGVAAAVPLIRTVILTTDAHGEDLYAVALGVDCGIEEIVGELGCDPAVLAATGDTPVLSDGLRAALGDDGLLHTNAGAIPAAGAPTSAALDDVAGGMIAVWSLEAAQRQFTLEGRVDQVLVVPEPGADPAALRRAVEDAVGPANQVLGADDAVDGSFVADQLLPGLLLTSIMGLTIGAQLVHTTLSLAFEERRRELAVAAAVGATPRLVAGGLVAEAAVLGLVGGLLGSVAAGVVGGAFVDGLSGQIERVVGVRLDTHVPPWVVAVGAVIGVVAAVAAAIGPARAAARLDLAGELAERDRFSPAARRRRLGLAVALAATAGGLVLGWLGWRDGSVETWQPTAVLVGLGVGATAAFRLPGLLATDVVTLVGRLPFARRGPVHVAVGTLLGDPRRTAAVANALGAAVALAVTLGAVTPSLRAASVRDSQDTIGGRVLVTSLGVNNTLDVASKLPPGALAALGEVDGVAQVTAYRHSSIDHPSVGVIDLSTTDGPGPRYRVYDGTDVATTLAAGNVMIGPGAARRLDARPGDRIALPGIDGVVEVEVGGIWGMADRLGSNMSLPPDLFRRIAGERPASYVSVQPDPGVSPAMLAGRIRDAGIGPQVLVFDPDELGEELGDEIAAFTDPFVALQRSLLVVAFAATLSTLLLAAVQRRRELAMLAAVGMSPGALGWMTLAEAALLGLVATAVGAVGGAVAYVGFLLASPAMTGLPLEWVVAWTAPLAAGLTATAVALAAAAWPAWRSTRIEPALALRYD